MRPSHNGPTQPPIPSCPADGPPYYLVRVTGLYLAASGWLVGDPRKAHVFGKDERAKAFALAKRARERKLWTGRIRVVRRKTLEASQW